MKGQTSVDLAGEQIVLLAESALFWRRKRTLVIADPHFGKPGAFRAASMPVPAGSTSRALERLDDAIDLTAAQRLIILGDFWHARAGRSERLLAQIADWRERRAELCIELLLGNHDRGVGLPPDEWGFIIHDRTVCEPPFVFSHFPDPNDGGYVLAGHLHPATVLSGTGRQRLRLPCYWFGKRVGVVPAFGEFTGCADIVPVPGDQLFVIADSEVIDVTRRC